MTGFSCTGHFSIRQLRDRGTYLTSAAILYVRRTQRKATAHYGFVGRLVLRIGFELSTPGSPRNGDRVLNGFDHRAEATNCCELVVISDDNRPAYQQAAQNIAARSWIQTQSNPDNHTTKKRLTVVVALEDPANRGADHPATAVRTAHPGRHETVAGQEYEFCLSDYPSDVCLSMDWIDCL